MIFLRTSLLAACTLAVPLAFGQSAPKLKVGLMLPYTGTYGHRAGRKDRRTRGRICQGRR